MINSTRVGFTGRLKSLERVGYSVEIASFL